MKERITNLNEVFYGKEPSFENVSAEDFTTTFANGMSWYKKNSTLEQRKEWFIQWLDENFPGDSKFVSQLNEMSFNIHGILTRMYSRGLVNDYITDKIIAAFHSLKNEQSMKRLEAQKKTQVSEKKEKVVDVRLSSMIADLEGKIDDYINSGYKEYFDMQDWLKNNSPSPVQAHEIREHFSILLNELKESFTDEDLKEAYSHMSLPQKKRFTDFVATIVETRMQRKQRKTRKKREVKIEKVVSKVKYLSHSPEFGIKSASPDKVFGAEGVMTFNNKYRVVNYLVPEVGKKLEIKGTTIQNIDEKKSFGKRIRKPLEILPILLKNNINTSSKTLNSLSTQAIEATGRLGNETLILKIF